MANKTAWTPIAAQFIDQGPIEGEPGFLVTLSASNEVADKKSVTAIAIGIGPQVLEWMEINFPDVLETARIRIAYAVPLQLNIQLNFIKSIEQSYLDSFVGTEISNVIYSPQPSISGAVSNWASKAITASGFVGAVDANTYSLNPDFNVSEITKLTNIGWAISGVDTTSNAPLNSEVGLIFHLNKTENSVDRRTSVITSYGPLTKSLLENTVTLPSDQVTSAQAAIANSQPRIMMSLQATLMGILGSTIATKDLEPTFIHGTKTSIPGKISNLINALSTQVVSNLY